MEGVSERSDGRIVTQEMVCSKVSGTDKEASTHTCAASALPEYMWASLLFSPQLLQPSDVSPSSSSSWGASRQLTQAGASLCITSIFIYVNLCI